MTKNLLSEGYNTVLDTPWPDMLIENRIRVVGENGKIVITPKFEYVTHFYLGKAIIGQGCKITGLDEEHHSFERKKHGYINEKGK